MTAGAGAGHRSTRRAGLLGLAEMHAAAPRRTALVQRHDDLFDFRLHGGERSLLIAGNHVLALPNTVAHPVAALAAGRRRRAGDLEQRVLLAARRVDGC